MDINIFNNSRISSIFLTYSDGQRMLRLPVVVRYIDKKECFLSAEVPVNFVKPRNNTKATVMAYTEVGVYSADTKIVDVNLSSVREITFSVVAPKNWDYKQLRTSSRKNVKVPFVIKYNDGYEFKGTTEDFSLSGISFISDVQMPELYQRFVAKITFDFSGFEGMENVTADVKFLRFKDDVPVKDGEFFYIYRIVEIGTPESLALKNFLIKVN